MECHRVLVVEDDLQLAQVLNRELQKLYITCVVHNGRDALFRAETEPFDLILLDLNLPDIDGLAVAEQLQNKDVDIIMLTARGDVQSRVAGLYSGASDYLSKPYDMQELLARVYAQFRKRSQQDEFRCGELSLSLKSKSCKVEGEPVALSAQEFRLLALLIANQGRVYSKNTLEDRLHQDAAPSSNTIEVLISRLRSKLASAGASDVIQTIRGLGYVVR